MERLIIAVLYVVNTTDRNAVCRHFKVQHGGQKYTCPYCTYTSGWKENINSHILRKHKGTV